MVLFSVQLCLNHATFPTQWLLPYYGPRREPSEVFLDVCQHRRLGTLISSLCFNCWMLPRTETLKSIHQKWHWPGNGFKCWTTSSLFKVKLHLFGCGGKCNEDQKGFRCLRWDDLIARNELFSLWTWIPEAVWITFFLIHSLKCLI